MGTFHKEWAHWLELGEETVELIETNLRGLSLDPSLHSISWEELILHLVPSWNQKGTKLKELDWPKNHFAKTTYCHYKKLDLFRKPRKRLLARLNKNTLQQH